MIQKRTCWKSHLANTHSHTPTHPHTHRTHVCVSRKNKIVKATAERTTTTSCATYNDDNDNGPHCCHMSHELAGRGRDRKREKERESEAVWNTSPGQKMMNDKIIQQMRTWPRSLLPSSSSSWHVTTNEDQLWLDILLFCYCYFCSFPFSIQRFQPNYGIEFPGILTFHLLVSSQTRQVLSMRRKEVRACCRELWIRLLQSWYL